MTEPRIAQGTRTAPPAASRATSCEVCGADIATMRAGTKYCGNRCSKRAQAGLGAPPPVKSYGTALAHPTYNVERCPRCDFPEADGGYCPSCGWSLPRPGTPGGWPLHPAGSLHGPVWDAHGQRVTPRKQAAA